MIAVEQLPRALEHLLRTRGVNLAGPLSWEQVSAKRVVLSDRAHVIARCARIGDATVSAAADELSWGAIIASASPAQTPLDLQPVELDGWAVSLWRYLPAACEVAPDDAAEHGRLLRAPHDTAPMPADAREPIDPLATTRARLHRMRAADSPVASVLEPLVMHAQYILDEQPPSQLVVVHGDAHDRNIIRMTSPCSDGASLPCRTRSPCGERER